MDAADLARRFGLGPAARLSDGPVARGKQGLVWRLDTADGSWTVKVPFHRSTEDEVRLATAFQEAACAAGVPAPRVRRTTEGRVFAMLEGRQVRMYEWVDLRAPDATLDPGRVGAVVAAIHRASAADLSPLDPWYHQPVGAGRWDHLVDQLRGARAPFAGQLADLRDELVALESWIEPAGMLRTCHRDLWADNVVPTGDGGVCVIDWENSGPADPDQELGCVLFEFARTDPGRVRALTDAYRQAGGPAAISRRGHFSMLIAQLGHITQTAATDWLKPIPARRSEPTPPRGSARFSTNRTPANCSKPSWPPRAETRHRTSNQEICTMPGTGPPGGPASRNPTAVGHRSHPTLCPAGKGPAKPRTASWPANRPSDRKT